MLQNKHQFSLGKELCIRSDVIVTISMTSNNLLEGKNDRPNTVQLLTTDILLYMRCRSRIYMRVSNVKLCKDMI
jgi:hypothetical protein